MKFFIAIGGLLVVALLVLLIGPSFVDWTAYRAQFEAEASRVLGRKVEVRGSAAARLLPFPSVRFSDVVVGDDPASPVLTVGAFRMDAELAPYLSGEIHIFHMLLEDAQWNLTIGADGRPEWPLGAAAGSGSAHVVLENIEVANASLRLDDTRSGRRIEAINLSGHFSARSLQGPFNGNGSFTVAGDPLDFTLSTGTRQPDATLPLRIGVSSKSADTAVSVEVAASGLPGSPIASGTLSVTRPLPATKVAENQEQPAVAPFQLTSRLAVEPSTVSLTDLRASIGAGEQPYTVTGSAALRLGTIPHFDLDLAGQQVDLDSLAPPAPATNGQVTVASRIAATRELVGRLPDIGLPGRLRLKLPLLTLGDTTIRNVDFSGSPATDGWSIERLQAELPGRTLVEASGVAEFEGMPKFRGSVLLAARQLPTFVRWLGASDATELSRVDSGGVSAEVELSPQRQVFEALEVNLGGEVLKGRLSRTVTADGASTELALDGGKVDLDRFLALGRLLPVEEGSRLESARLDLQFSAGPVTYQGFSAQRIETDLTLDSGMLDVRDALALGLAGADLHLEGTVADIASAPQPDLSLDISANQPQSILEFFRRLRPESPLLASLGRTGEHLGPLKLAGTAATEMVQGQPSLRVDLKGDAAGTAVDAKLAIENGLAAVRENGRFGVAVTLRNDDPVALLRQFGIAGLPTGPPGPLSVDVSLSGAPDQPVTASLRARAPGSEVSADGSVGLGSDGLESADLKTSLQSNDLSPWLLATGIAAGQPAEGLPVDLAGRLSWAGVVWSLTDLAGELDQSRVSGSMHASVDGPVTGDLHVSDLSATWLATLVTGTAVTDSGDGSTPFGVSLLPARSVDVGLRVDRLDMPGGPIVDFHADLTATDEALRLDGLTGTYRTGDLTGSLALRNAGAVVSLDTDMALKGIPVSISDGASGLDGRFDLRLAAKGVGGTLDALRTSLTGSGTLQLADGTLHGVAPDLLTPLLVAADAESFQPTNETVSALVDDIRTDSTYQLPPLSADMNLTAGTLRLQPITVSEEGETLVGEVAFDLRNAAVTGVLEQRFDTAEALPDTPTPALAYRLGGTLADPQITLDVGALTRYVAARAYQREQARLEAIQEDLRETVRLRREARLYRWRQDVRDALRNDRLAAEEAARRETERKRREAEEAQARAAAEAAARAAAATPAPIEASPRTSPNTSGSRPLDLEVPVPDGPQPPASFGGLPGVQNPNTF